MFFTLYCVPYFIVNNQAHAFFFIQAEEENNEEAKMSSEEGKNSVKKIQHSHIKIVKPISIFAQQKSDLIHYFSQDKTQKLKVDANEYIIIEEVSATQNNKGVAILLPDWQQSVANPKAMNYLRKSLTLDGWATMSIQSPNKPNNYPSSALMKKEIIEQNTKALMLYRNELKSLITAAMERAKSYPGIFLVISEGSQAVMLTDLYKNEKSLLPTAFITLSAGIYSQAENNMFAKNIASAELPILDLILKRDNKSVLENAMLRKQYATKEMKVYYRQKKISNIIPGYYPEKKLRDEINGWLKTIGW